MIFNNNTTSLGVSNIPMAEGYDCSTGVALALIESAQNDYAMFRAMLDVDAKEIRINNESAGYVNEAEIIALQEAAGVGIFKKIKELFTKLIAKIKAIFHTFFSKINGLFMKDKDLVKKYKDEILRKTNIGNLEVKWCKLKGKSPLIMEVADLMATKTPTSLNNFLYGYEKEADERFKKFAGVDESDYAEHCNGLIFEDEDTLKVSEIGGARGICDYLEGCSKKMNTLKTNINKLNGDIEKLVKAADDKVSEYTKKDADSDAAKEALDQLITQASQTYDMATVYQTVVLRASGLLQDAVKKEYKQNKAAFMKCISANDKKLEESAVYANALAEAAEDEVDSVISNAISASDLADLNDADTTVLGSDAGEEASEMDTSCVKSESAYFGELLY